MAFLRHFRLFSYFYFRTFSQACRAKGTFCRIKWNFPVRRNILRAGLRRLLWMDEAERKGWNWSSWKAEKCTLTVLDLRIGVRWSGVSAVFSMSRSAPSMLNIPSGIRDLNSRHIFCWLCLSQLKAKLTYLCTATLLLPFLTSTVKSLRTFGTGELRQVHKQDFVRKHFSYSWPLPLRYSHFRVRLASPSGIPGSG